MLDSTVALLLGIAAIGAGLMTGVYFAFSGFIMRAFDQLGAAAATEAMNAINEVILRSGFMFLFFASTLIYGGLALLASFDASIPGRGLLVAAGLIYVIGMFICTAAFNVPLNNRLAAAGAHGEDGAWPQYYRHWTRWNHLRTGCSLAACAVSIAWLVAHA